MNNVGSLIHKPDRIDLTNPFNPTNPGNTTNPVNPTNPGNTTNPANATLRPIVQ